MMYLDKNPNIINWSYEPQCIKYFDKVTNKIRRYFIDFIATVNTGSILKTVWIEVKSVSECQPPKNKKNIQAMRTWITNTCKWQAAMQTAKIKGYEFHILNEKQLT